MWRLRQKIMIAALAVGMLCAGYTAQWQSRMEMVYQVKIHLAHQGDGSWMLPVYHEARCFPVRRKASGEKGYVYDQSYGEGRTYGGRRSHEGVDILLSDHQTGKLKIQSVSNGVIEKLGWLELGGYRIGIRSDSGMYYYYAHMDSYAPGLKEGSTVCAGQFLGYMGDTGYGPERTHGKFPIHLHFGIYVDEQGKEKSLDPYYLLRYLDCGMIGWF